MELSFIVRASTKIGFGHLVRSRSLAEEFSKLTRPTDRINYYIIGAPSLGNLLAHVPFEIGIFESEYALLESYESLALSDVVIFDLLSLSDKVFSLTQNAKYRVSLSPIFDQLGKVDALFHRTKYFEKEYNNAQVYKGLEYTIIQSGCRQIQLATFKKNLEESRLSIAIAMGGGDAANKTLRVINKLNEIKEDLTIWAMLGEGYKHSYDDLIEASKLSHHEIILAKTNESMWRVLGLASLLLLPGGITTYEAVFAGLPTINIIENENQEFLVRELVEKGVSEKVEGLDDPSLLSRIANFVENRDQLYQMHLNSKGLIDQDAGARIFEKIIIRLNSTPV